MESYTGRVFRIATVDDDSIYTLENDKEQWNWDEEWLEPVADVKTIKDLKDGDVVTLRNGDRLLYCDENFVDLDDTSHNSVCNIYNLEDDLTRCVNDPKQDIVKVERPLTYYEVFNRDDIVREMTVEEISKALGYEVKIVKEK